MGLLEETAQHLSAIDRGFAVLKTSVARRLAACKREHAAAAKRKGGAADGTKWGAPVFEPWLAGETPHDANPGGAAGHNRRARPGADENPAPHT